jgi:hypothetical protein
VRQTNRPRIPPLLQPLTASRNLTRPDRGNVNNAYLPRCCCDKASEQTLSHSAVFPSSSLESCHQIPCVFSELHPTCILSYPIPSYFPHAISNPADHSWSFVSIRLARSRVNQSIASARLQLTSHRYTHTLQQRPAPWHAWITPCEFPTGLQSTVASTSRQTMRNRDQATMAM